MAIDMFLKIEGVSGESKDTNHKDWTDLESFDWGADQSGSMSSGGGGGAGKVNFNDLTVVCAIDKAAPTILKNCAVGQHISKVEVSVCKAGGTQIEYSRTTLEDVLVTSVKFIGAQDSDVLKIRYAFQAAKVKTQYWEQSDKGSKGAEVQMAFNIKENKSI
jgi:type VI secretion system secreted protein Hcp